MKNLTKTLVAFSLGIVLLFSSFVAGALEKAIKQIILTGNVRVTLIQSNYESVVIQQDYDHEKTVVKMVGNSLLINSQEHIPISVTVYAKAPYRIKASNTSCINTVGTLNVKNLQIMLSDKAKANVSTLTNSLYTLIKDDSRLRISGISQEHFANYDSSSQIKMDRLVCLNTSTVITKPFIMNAKNIIISKKLFKKNKKMRS
jgi:hypothetical protein